MKWPIDERAVALIKEFESLHDGDLSHAGLQPKQDPLGIWTAGWGRALRDPHTGVFLHGAKDKGAAYAMCPRLTAEDADAMLAEDLGPVASGVFKAVKVEIGDAQHGALASFAYNLGLGALKASTLLRRLNEGDHFGAADEFLKWDKAMFNGRKVALRGLTRRRKAERLLFLSDLKVE